MSAPAIDPDKLAAEIADLSDAMRSRMSKLEAMKVMEYFDHVASADNAPAPNPCMPNNMPCPACPPPARSGRGSAPRG